MRASFARFAVTLVAAGALMLSGCAQDSLAEQYRAGSGKQYIAGDSSVTEVPPENRSDPVEFSVVTSEGDPVTHETYQGKVLVLNYWYAACAPCRAEAPALSSLHREFEDESVEFLGVNVRDGKETADAFNRTYDIEFPSVLDTEDRSGGLLLAFSGEVAANAVPTTLIVDAQGRVAARILGEFDPSVLRTLIRDTLAETTTADAGNDG